MPALSGMGSDLSQQGGPLVVSMKGGLPWQDMGEPRACLPATDSALVRKVGDRRRRLSASAPAARPPLHRIRGGIHAHDRPARHRKHPRRPRGAGHQDAGLGTDGLGRASLGRHGEHGQRRHRSRRPRRDPRRIAAGGCVPPLWPPQGRVLQRRAGGGDHHRRRAADPARGLSWPPEPRGARPSP